MSSFNNRINLRQRQLQQLQQRQQIQLQQIQSQQRERREIENSIVENNKIEEQRIQMLDARRRQQLENDRSVRERNRTRLSNRPSISDRLSMSDRPNIYLFEVTLRNLINSLCISYDASDNNIINDYSIYNDFNEYELYQNEIESKTVKKDKFDKFKKVTFDKEKNILLSNDDKCSICCEVYKNNDKLIQLDCKHCFHEKCIKKWLLEESNKCPLCNKIY